MSVLADLRDSENTSADDVPPAVALRPLAYAYMRVPRDIPDEKVRRMEHELKRFADRQGFCLAAIFYEFECGSQEAFEELVQELRRSDAHHVVLPSFRHLARNMLLQNGLLARLEFDAQAEAHVLADTNA